MIKEQENIMNIVNKVNPDDPLSFALNAVKPLAVNKLNEIIKECDDCEICKNKTKTLFSGNVNAPVLIIGECPNKVNPNKNLLKPFESEEDSYRHLKNVFDYLNINTDKLAFINAVNCVPTRNNGEKRAPTVRERNNCKDILDYAIKIVDPILIICLGGVAVNGINEEIGKQNISKIRGNYFNYRGIKVMPTYHPGYFESLLEHSSAEIAEIQFDEFSSDLDKAFKDLDAYSIENDFNLNIYK